MMGRSLTQFDVAKAAGVSRSTVSAVLRPRPSTSVISKEKKRRVLEAAQKLNYQPHFAARSLRAGKTHNIAFAVPGANTFAATIPSQILTGIMERSRQLGYSLTVSTYDTNDSSQTSFENLVRASRFDGFFHFGGQEPDSQHKAEICAQWHKPYVVLQRPVTGATSICFDDVLGGKLAIEALQKADCKNVAVISDDPSSYYTQRLEGALDQANQAGIEVQVFKLGSDLAESGRHAAAALLEQGMKVDGIYGAADQVALGCIQELSKYGVKIPEDIAIVGHDDGPMAALANPALTSVRQDGNQMGRKAMDMLHQRIEAEKDIPSNQQKIAPKLIERESTNPKAKEAEKINVELQEELVCV